MGPADSPYRRLIIVSYRLPFKAVVRDGVKTVEPSSGGLVSAIRSLSEKPGAGEPYRDIVWVGKGDESIADVVALGGTKSKYELVPVAISDEVDQGFYGGFSNDLLWPLFHYFPSLAVFDEKSFEHYQAANRLFAATVEKLARPGDFIWIHDYHLCLLPALVRERFPAASIGFFLHIPFPAFELFRILPRRWGEALLRGMLGADLVGFHTYDYCQYFQRSVSRYLGCDIAMNKVLAEGRVVRVDAYPIGIDYETFDGATHTAEVGVEREKLVGSLFGQKLVFSVDRLDYSKGFLHRLAGFECFLDTYPEWVGKVVFNMVVIPSRDTIASYQEMKHEIEATVGRINGKYSTMAWRPIFYQYKSLSFSELVALYSVADVGLITPVRDGMNLVAKEYIACQTKEKGMLVLSETAGAAAELAEALLINPTDKRDVAEALNRALTMPARDRAIRVARMQKRIRQYTVFTWADSMLRDAAAIKAEQQARQVSLMTSERAAEVVARYGRSSRRAVVVDYDGTLVPLTRIPELAVPDAQTTERVRRLVANPKNTVVIISGRNKGFLEEWLGNLGSYLIAEHGAFEKRPGGSWQCMIDPDQSWKEHVWPILQRYQDRCNGAFIEEKASSLAWHYRNAATEMGALRATEMTEELRELLSRENKLQVLEGHKVVEVKRTGYDKGFAAAKIVAGAGFDFVLAMGDDKTDEDVFRALPQDALTIKVGLTATMAKYNLINQRDVEWLLDRLIDSEPLTVP